MRPTQRIVLTITIAFMLMSLVVGNVHATNDDKNDDSLMVSIESADYLDLDSDQIEDDILTEFTIALPDGDWRFCLTYMHGELELPSGLTFTCDFLLFGSYSTLSVSLAWYNTAIESGWFTFRIYVRIFGNDVPAPGSDVVVFDPPTEGDPAPPIIEIIELTPT